MDSACVYPQHCDMFSFSKFEELLTDNIQETIKLFESYNYRIGPYITLRAMGEDFSGHSIFAIVSGREKKIGFLKRIDPKQEASIINKTLSTYFKLRN